MSATLVSRNGMEGAQADERAVVAVRMAAVVVVVVGVVAVRSCTGWHVNVRERHASDDGDSVRWQGRPTTRVAERILPSLFFFLSRSSRCRRGAGRRWKWGRYAGRLRCRGDGEWQSCGANLAIGAACHCAGPAVGPTQSQSQRDETCQQLTR